MSELLQFLLSGVTVGAVYALVALGFTIIYNASEVVNFSQGEFVMLGGMSTVFLFNAGVPLPAAALASGGLGLTNNQGRLIAGTTIAPERWHRGRPTARTSGFAGLRPLVMARLFCPAVGATAAPAIRLRGPTRGPLSCCAVHAALLLPWETLRRGRAKMGRAT